MGLRSDDKIGGGVSLQLQPFDNKILENEGCILAKL